ncbi:MULTISPECIES: universal stress protein [Croceibacter]|jgi:nucleotide-binding universal stress UspA family protein|uniref:Universal stress protein n=1 Tax=Croceibacter atlanticus (strain ATCC BAA-628 / JCM 21780 / CIP 108009 / IAM 15332 / KCTC 12090 / HTCC2559) TaxID=216432 RepID=A3U542_CROAH|nr:MULTISPECIES: universal stress protein [Croceibacter]EAP87359.1 universal stress protein [Croceibacter atlanticus HTCC2559]MAM22482.1 universal stress protein [Croceibacter sp.]MBG24479.1 universal stress protein [Croceibacter sp.]MBW4970407.1 universal stress protein [Croceibacter atlanticus]WSP34966.1 universal stress protein [Croceibacter atlanticus]|tara:strand:+ start:2370 stop:3200 length:831 start_codon:yes stop_codon:yes gene_type:complete
MKNILVPTDFSEQAENALKVAAQFAKTYNADIYLLHMLELPMQLIDPTSNNNSQNLPESLFFMKLAHKRFEEVLASDYLEGVTVHETVHFHEAFDGIMEVSKEHDCDLIIMGSHGATGFKEMFIGSNTEKVVRYSEIPVLVIKQEIPNFRVDNFIFATDFSEETKRPFNEAVKFANKIDANIHLVYINTANKFKTTEEAEKKMSNFLEGMESKTFNLHIYNDRTIEEGILNYAQSIDAGLIGISTHGRKGLAHFFNGSLSEDIVNHAKRPVITFKI